MGQSASTSEASSSSDTTTQYFTDSFNKTFNRVNNYENVGNISLGDSALSSIGGGAGTPAGDSTSFMPIIMGLVAIVVVIILIGIMKR